MADPGTITKVELDKIKTEVKRVHSISFPWQSSLERAAFDALVDRQGSYDDLKSALIKSFASNNHMSSGESNVLSALASEYKKYQATDLGYISGTSNNRGGSVTDNTPTATLYPLPAEPVSGSSHNLPGPTATLYPLPAEPVGDASHSQPVSDTSHNLPGKTATLYPLPDTSSHGQGAANLNANPALPPQGASAATPSSAVSNTPAAPMFTLVKAEGGDGSVYVLNNRGERFHVTEKLMNEMIAGGSWSEPEVRPAADVNAMNLRFTVDSVGDLYGINNATFDAGNHTYMLVKGNGAPNPDNNQLIGNGNAIYAVDEHGQKVHVTGEAFNQLGAVPVANITQTAVDSNSVSGALVAPNGTLSTTTDANLDPSLKSAMPFNLLTQPIDDLMNQAVTSANSVINGGATPATPATPADPGNSPATPATPATPPQPQDESLDVQLSAQGTGDFNFIRNDADGSIYAVNAGHQKFHITGELWEKLSPEQKHFRTATAEELNYPNGSNVDLVNMDQLRSININASKEFRLVKGNGTDKDDSILEDNGRAVYALTSNGDRYHVTAELANKMGGAFSNVETINQKELDSLGTMKGSISTVAELNKAVKTSGPASGFNGDTSAIPGAIPPMAGYPPTN